MGACFDASSRTWTPRKKPPVSQANGSGAGANLCLTRRGIAAHMFNRYPFDYEPRRVIIRAVVDESTYDCHSIQTDVWPGILSLWERVTWIVTIDLTR